MSWLTMGRDIYDGGLYTVWRTRHGEICLCYRISAVIDMTLLHRWRAAPLGYYCMQIESLPRQTAKRTNERTQ